MKLTEANPATDNGRVQLTVNASTRCTIRPPLPAAWAFKTEGPREKQLKTVSVSGRKINELK